MISNDTARCEGHYCPGATNCRRYTERGQAEYQPYAAFWARRDAGADSCESMIPVRNMSTYKDES